MVHHIDFYQQIYYHSWIQQVDDQVEEEVKKKIKEINLVKDSSNPVPCKTSKKNDTTDYNPTEDDTSEVTDATTDEDTKRLQSKVQKKAAVLKTIDKQLA